jgi:hypothetical protein
MGTMIMWVVVGTASAEPPPANNPPPVITTTQGGEQVPAGLGALQGQYEEHHNRIWATGEYLLWWQKDSPLPPLVTTSPATSAGVLGQPGTTILFGGSGLDQGAFSGGRIAVGAWLDDCQTVGLEADFFFLDSRSQSFNASSSGAPGSPVLARPFINNPSCNQDAELVSFPGVLAGSVHVAESSRLWGAGANGICNLCSECSCGCRYRVDLQAGFRYLRLDENLGIAENLVTLAGSSAPAGTTFAVVDRFDTRNQFYGGQLGVQAEIGRGNLFVKMSGLLALGDTHSTLNTNGTTVITLPGSLPQTLPGGLLALPTNSGRFHQDRFSVAPQLEIDVGYQVTDHVRVFMGYSFLYWGDVLRPGNQIDPVINPTQVPSTLGPGTLIGAARPAVLLKESDYWAQGLNFGVTIQF